MQSLLPKIDIFNLLIMTDGRDYIYRTVDSAMEHLLIDGKPNAFNMKLIHSDGVTFDSHLRGSPWSEFAVIPALGRLGFGASLRRAWNTVVDLTRGEGWLFHLEDDFVFNHDIELLELAEAMRAYPNLAQMALVRQPWNPAERKAGGIIASRPGEFTMLSDGKFKFSTQRSFYTTNPHLVSVPFIAAHPWPTGDHSEGRYSIELFKDPSALTAFWGHGEEQVTHIGDERAGNGY